jgi:hypothetical protein
MPLHKTGHEYAGYYYYNSRQEPVSISGDDTTTDVGKIRLSVFLPDTPNQENFIFSISWFLTIYIQKAGSLCDPG